MRARRNTARKASLFFLAACAAAWGQSSSVTLTAGGGPWSASADAYPNILSNPYDCQNPGEPDNIGSMSVSLPTNSCSLTGEEIEVSCSNTSPVQPGTYTVTADYSGFGGVDENNNPCTVPGSSASANITVTAYTTSIALELPSSLTFQSGQTLTIPLTIPYTCYQCNLYMEGTVSLYYGSTAFGATDVDGETNYPEYAMATIAQSTKGLPPGSYSVYVGYSGDGDYGPSSSSSFTIKILKAQYATTTALTVTPNPTVEGQPTAITAKVTPTGITVPTGSVTLLSGSTTLGKVTLTNGSGTLTVPADMPTGTYQLQALYSGDSFNFASTSAAVEVTIVATTSTKTAVTVSPSPIVAGATAQLTATVTPAISNVVPTGTVTVTANGAPVTTLTLNHGSATETFSTAGLPAGTYAIVGKYNGSTLATASTSPVDSVVISPVTSVSVVASPNPVASGSISTLTATVKSGSAPVTSGTVTFSYIGNVLGTTHMTSNGTSALPIETTAFGTGTFTIEATFNGTANAPAATGTVSLVIN